MKRESKAKIKYGIWGLIFGAIIIMILGFGWGGWSTAAMTRTVSKEAVLASQAAICVAQFMKETNQEEKLTEFEKVGRYNRVEFIEKGGWDKMPGQEKANNGVAKACVDGLELLIKK